MLTAGQKGKDLLMIVISWCARGEVGDQKFQSILSLTLIVNYKLQVSLYFALITRTFVKSPYTKLLSK